jgi:hypothetical protein
MRFAVEKSFNEERLKGKVGNGNESIPPAVAGG